MIVLIFVYERAVRHSTFNFDAIYSTYQRYIIMHESQDNKVQEITRAQFLKLFLDLIDKGFLRSESDMDILNVNNRVAVGFDIEDFRKLIEAPKLLDRLHLPTSIRGMVDHLSG